MATGTDQLRRDVATAHNAVYLAQQLYGPRTRQPRRVTMVDRFREFVRRYGWRAYALPVLAVISVVALLTSKDAPANRDAAGNTPNAASNHAGQNAASGGGATMPRPAGSHIALKSDAPGPNANNSALKAAALPPGAPYPMRGDGTYRVLPGTSPKIGSGHLYRYSIDVENGMTGLDLTSYQHLVMAVLADKRSWAGHGVALQRVDSGPIDFHVTLVSSMTIRKTCGYTIHVETSCYTPAGSAPGITVNRVELNDSRWVRGDAAYLGDLAAYRTYMINHEVGHALGHEHAHECLPDGLAPVMMQQTFGLLSAVTGKSCEANPWPYPPGARGAPGAEQPDTPQNDEYGLGKLSAD